MSKQQQMKSFQLNGLNIYVTGVVSKNDAVCVCWQARWGICDKDLIEVERVPDGVPHYGLYNKPDFDPRYTICIDMQMEYEHARETIY